MIPNPRHTALAAAIAAPLLLAVHAPAESASTDFNDIAKGQLRDKAGGEGFADNATWTGSTTMVQVAPGDLNAPAQTSYNLTQSGDPHKVRMTHSEDRVVHRSLAATLGGQIWGSFVVNVPADGKAGLGFNTPPLHSTFSAQSLVVEPGGEPGQDGLDLVYRSGSTEQSRAAKAVTPDMPTLIVYRIIYSPKSPNKGFAAWINPNLLEPLPEPAVFSPTIGNGNITSLTVGGMGKGELDLLHISDDADAFTDVTGQPFVVTKTSQP